MIDPFGQDVAGLLNFRPAPFRLGQTPVGHLLRLHSVAVRRLTRPEKLSDQHPDHDCFPNVLTPSTMVTTWWTSTSLRASCLSAPPCHAPARLSCAAMASLCSRYTTQMIVVASVLTAVISAAHGITPASAAAIHVAAIHNTSHVHNWQMVD